MFLLSFEKCHYTTLLGKCRRVTVRLHYLNVASTLAQLLKHAPATAAAQGGRRHPGDPEGTGVARAVAMVFRSRCDSRGRRTPDHRQPCAQISVAPTLSSEVPV